MSMRCEEFRKPGNMSVLAAKMMAYEIGPVTGWPLCVPRHAGPFKIAFLIFPQPASKIKGARVEWHLLKEIRLKYQVLKD